mmetsp:Transcript_9876/g.14353  ORF Transcript_9876/g.14353 Transcript_9876/m.14353 type:complete len:736 (-) Transcript_9876:398-2605(-)
MSTSASASGVKSSSSSISKLTRKMTSSSTDTITTSDSNSNHPLSKLLHSFDHSWVNNLSAETQSNREKSKRKSSQDDGISNNIKRPVYNGHWVPTTPDPLRNPRLIIASPQVVNDIGLEYENVHSDEFVKYFSGDVHTAFDDHGDVEGKDVKTWATPYALSIMGKRYTSNCPFGTGDGYGDGRAMSIGEVNNADTTSRYELQLKGAGPTPFCRGADGRAVLRSSIREFLASEAMHYLGISTTRALSLIVSEDGDDENGNGKAGNTSQRPWYSEQNQKNVPTVDDPRLERYSPEQRKQIVAQLNAQTRNDPDVMVEEPNAITCRVAPSFMRVGHIDLFSRRATKNTLSENEIPDKNTPEFKELEDIIWHACFREFPSECYEPFIDDNDILSASKCLLDHSLDGIAAMVAGWVRVGFAQGNFNGDNCLVAGRTMDYGPFGWMEEYHPLFAKWTGSGEHFGFLNQPNAGFANYVMLLSSIMPIIEAYSPSLEEARKYETEMTEKGQQVFQDKLMQELRSKLGFHPEDESADDLWQEVEVLMRESKVDWTLFWRQLTYVEQEFPVGSGSKAYGEMFDVLNASKSHDGLKSPFYEQLDTESRSKFFSWIQQWRETLEVSYDSENYGSSAELCQQDLSEAGGTDEKKITSPAERMRLANPKYVLREWILVDAYTKASTSSIRNPIFPMKKLKSERGDETMIHELFNLIKNPYDEGTDEQDEKYYRRASSEALKKGGVAFMS